MILLVSQSQLRIVLYFLPVMGLFMNPALTNLGQYLQFGRDNTFSAHLSSGRLNVCPVGHPLG